MQTASRFEEMARFYRQHIWVDGQRDEWNDWLTMVRERRNAVHAFNHRELGTWDEFWQAVVRYHEFIGELDSRVPYPDKLMITPDPKSARGKSAMQITFKKRYAPFPAERLEAISKVLADTERGLPARRSTICCATATSRTRRQT